VTWLKTRFAINLFPFIDFLITCDHPGLGEFYSSHTHRKVGKEVKWSSLPKQRPVGKGQYDANYGNFQVELYEQVRREAFGEDIGQNSWLTADEQDNFLNWLALSGGKTLLDAGCGAGGPVLRAAASLAARLWELTLMNRRFQRQHLLPPSAA